MVRVGYTDERVIVKIRVIVGFNGNFRINRNLV